MKRKYPAIDVMKFYLEFDHKKWNQFLYNCYVRKNVRKLEATRYGLQAGMTDLADQKLNSDQISVTFLRWQKSIEDTIKLIYRDEFANPLYDPKNKHLRADFIDDKRKKDHELELILRKSRF